jgi:hypothetical protein
VKLLIEIIFLSKHLKLDRYQSSSSCFFFVLYSNSTIFVGKTKIKVYHTLSKIEKKNLRNQFLLLSLLPKIPLQIWSGWYGFCCECVSMTKIGCLSGMPISFGTIVFPYSHCLDHIHAHSLNKGVRCNLYDYHF